MDTNADQPTSPPAAPSTPAVTTPAPTDLSTPSRLRSDEKWLEAFYRECGREVTLAYTTLNQMKNWAMLVTAAAISGLAFSSSSPTYPKLSMLVGIVVVYTFTLRFFVRAMLCYINLLRWNKLQSDCVQLKLVVAPTTEGGAKALSDLEKQLEEDIQNYYHRWLSPCDRKTQFLSNLKLGFYLLFALPLFFMLWGFVALWHEPLARGLAVFVVGDTFVELNDFFKSQFFDNVLAYERRKTRGKLYDIFPVPTSRGWFLASWITVLLLSIVVATWHTVWPWLTHLLCAAPRP